MWYCLHKHQLVLFFFGEGLCSILLSQLMKNIYLQQQQNRSLSHSGWMICWGVFFPSIIPFPTQTKHNKHIGMIIQYSGQVSVVECGFFSRSWESSFVPKRNSTWCIMYTVITQVNERCEFPAWRSFFMLCSLNHCWSQWAWLSSQLQWYKSRMTPLNSFGLYFC